LYYDDEEVIIHGKLYSRYLGNAQVFTTDGGKNAIVEANEPVFGPRQKTEFQ